MATDQDTRPTYPDPMEFSTSPRNRLLMLGLGLVATAASTAVIVWPPTRGRMAGAGWIAWLGLLLFGAATLYFGYRLVRRRSALRLDADGLVDTSGPASVGRVRWDEVIEAIPIRIGVASMIGVQVRDPDAVLAGVNPVKRALGAANGDLAGTPVWINAQGLPADEVAGLVNSYRAQWAKAHDQPR